DLEIQFGRAATEAQTFFHGEQNLANPEQPDDRDQEVEAVEHLFDAKREAQLSGNLIEADGPETEAEHHRGHRLEWRLLAQSHKAAESQEIDRENFSRTEAQRKARHQWRDQRDHDDREKRPDEG